MDWLRKIIEKATDAEGKVDVEAVMKAVETELPKHTVSKKEYDDKVEELNTASKTIADLKKANGDNVDLQKKIGDYETEIKNLKTAAENTRKEYALKEKLTAAGAIDADYLIYKHGGLEKFAFDKDGKPIGVEDILNPLKKDSPHLFKTAETTKPSKGSGYAPRGGETNEGGIAKSIAESLNKADTSADNPYAKAWG